MNKIVFLLFLTIFIFANKVICQVVNAETDINKDSRRFIEIATKSDAVKVPDSINVILTKFAQANKLWEPGVLKNAMMLKPLFNNALSMEDRLYASDYLMKLYNDPKSLVPVALIKNIKSSLISTPKLTIR
jgi:Na+-transporting methylmalonyl-CoA/oxaloacetate decarboxylase gamma subunit